MEWSRVGRLGGQRVSTGILRSASLAGFFRELRRAGKRIGEAQARALMSAFYFVVLGPVFFVGIRRRDPLDLNSVAPPAWREVHYRCAADHKHQQY